MLAIAGVFWLLLGLGSKSTRPHVRVCPDDLEHLYVWLGANSIDLSLVLHAASLTAMAVGTLLLGTRLTPINGASLA